MFSLHNDKIFDFDYCFKSFSFIFMIVVLYYSNNSSNRDCRKWPLCVFALPGVKVCWRPSLEQKPTRSGRMLKLSSTKNSPQSIRELHRKPEQTNTGRLPGETTLFTSVKQEESHLCIHIFWLFKMSRKHIQFISGSKDSRCCWKSCTYEVLIVLLKLARETFRTWAWNPNSNCWKTPTDWLVIQWCAFMKPGDFTETNEMFNSRILRSLSREMLKYTDRNSFLWWMQPTLLCISFQLSRYSFPIAIMGLFDGDDTPE